MNPAPAKFRIRRRNDAGLPQLGRPEAVAQQGQLLLGDCIEVMTALPPRSVDLILTDPPYIVHFRDRSDRTVPNDDNAAWLEPSAAAMYRVLKDDAFCVSFYSWAKVDLFMAAWRKAGFRVVGHFAFRKGYTSRTAFLQYRHEMAYLLAKGRPAYPARPIADVIDWSNTGNTLHPTQKPTSVLRPIVEAFSGPGDLVLDPFAGSGSTCVAALETRRRYLGIELHPAHHATAKTRLSGAEREAETAAREAA